METTQFFCFCVNTSGFKLSKDFGLDESAKDFQRFYVNLLPHYHLTYMHWPYIICAGMSRRFPLFCTLRMLNLNWESMNASSYSSVPVGFFKSVQRLLNKIKQCASERLDKRLVKFVGFFFEFLQSFVSVFVSSDFNGFFLFIFSTAELQKNKESLIANIHCWRKRVCA